MRVDLACQILRLQRDVNVTYQPVCEGLELLEETGDPQASLENARRLLAYGFTYLSAISGPGGIIIVFQTGHLFLGTGFALGGGPKTEAFALAMSEMGAGLHEDLAEFYTSLASWNGPIPR